MSSALVPSGGSSGSNAFAQQGTVDWTALSGSTVNFSVEILARLSKAGVEPVTVAMGQAIFSGFNLDPEGQKRFSDALSRLKAFSSYGNVMYFGFGVKHIVRTLSETEQGATCAAICACLSVSYDKLFCSKVLRALANQQRAPNSLMPSLSQWAALVNICSGAVSSTQFPQLVEVYSGLTQSYDNDTYNLQEPTSASALAIALSELAKVSSGSVRSVTFIGGVDCGWLAALAKWLLSLRVDIISADGSVLYSSRTSVDPSYYPQVSIVQHIPYSGSQKNTILFKESVYITPGRLFFDLQGETVSKKRSSFSAGRPAWSTILHDTFGEQFDALLSPEVIQDFAELLLCGFSVSVSDTGQRHVDPWGCLSTTSAERQLSQLSFAAQRLPELIAVCQVAKQRASYQGRKKYNMHNTFRRLFTRHCLCDRCEFYSDYTAGKDRRVFPILQKNCLERTALTIFEYIWTLSWLDIDEDIYPSVCGLLLMYGNQQTYKCDNIPIHVIKNKLFIKSLISITIELLTGQPDYSHYGMNSASAECKGGICVYLPSLQNPTTSPPEQLRAIVVGGHIEWNGKVFSRVEDGRSERLRGPTNHLASTLAETYGLSTKIKIVVEETFTSDILEADFWIFDTPITAPSYLISRHAGHVADEGPNLSLICSFGASEIRSSILLYSHSTTCNPSLVKIDAGLTSWSGPCSKAVESLWADGYNNKCHIPTTNEWVLISESRCCQEIVRGPYQLLYSVICTVAGSSKIRLSSGACLICLLRTYREHNAMLRGYLVINGDIECILEHVAVHSFLRNTPSSQVLLTSATFPQHSFTMAHTSSDSNRESVSSDLRGQWILPPSSLNVEPLSEDDSTTSDGGYESGSSVSSSRSIRHWMPRPERDRESSTPSERPRARSV